MPLSVTHTPGTYRQLSRFKYSIFMIKERMCLNYTIYNDSMGLCVSCMIVECMSCVGEMIVMIAIGLMGILGMGLMGCVIDVGKLWGIVRNVGIRVCVSCVMREIIILLGGVGMVYVSCVD